MTTSHPREERGQAGEGEDRDICFICDQPILDGQLAHIDVTEGAVHAACCGPEAEAYVDADGAPLKPGDPIPEPYRYAAPASQAAPVTGTEGEKSGAGADVLAERRRQIEAECWTPEHDDTHPSGDLAQAAASYAMHAGYVHRERVRSDFPPANWPWSRDWWKPTTRRRDLVKAGALILAEIERLDREEARKSAEAERGS